MSQIIATPEIVPAEIVKSESLTPVELLRIAVSQGADIEKLTKLMDLQERWEANEARKAYNAAMKKFKENPPIISKNKTVNFETRNGNANYKHATLDHVCDVITKGLSAVGITHSWKVKQEKDLITVTCTLTHEAGHSESTDLSGVHDNSGSKNAIQAVGSTVTYLQRYTLLAATGMAAKNDDTDGAVSSKPVMPVEKLEEYARQMSEVETTAELQAVFTKAYREASELTDKKAMAFLIQCKDEAKKRRLR